MHEVCQDFREAMRALQESRHVIIPADLSMEEETQVKREALQRGLLVLGPRCSTSVLGGKGFGTWNSLKEGPAGLIGTSASSLRALSCILDQVGISHVLHVGSRDLSQRIGALGTDSALKFLEADSATEIIVVVSVAPSSNIQRKLASLAEGVKKPCIFCLLGFEKKAHFPLEHETTLEDIAALTARSLGETLNLRVPSEFLEKESAELVEGQRHVRGVYTGRGLCIEAQAVLSTFGKTVYSNVPLNPRLRLPDPRSSRGHSCVDMSELGEGHPVQDPAPSASRILRESKDLGLAAVMLDVALGNAAHPDPAGILAPAIREAREAVEETGGHLPVMVFISGTRADPQGLHAQARKLEKNGAILLPTPTALASFAGMLVGR